MRQLNRWSFYLYLFCLILSGYSFYATMTTIWSVAPPVYIIFIFAVAAFIMSVIGFGGITGWLTALRSWFTVLLSFILSFILLMVIVLLPDGKQPIKTTHSPDGHYTIRFYITNGGGTTSIGVDGILDGPLWFKKNIYLDSRMDHANVKWENNNTIVINHNVLNLKKGETYSD